MTYICHMSRNMTKIDNILPISGYKVNIRMIYLTLVIKGSHDEKAVTVKSLQVIVVLVLES